jgi:CheY-like chemotaxis protein
MSPVIFYIEDQPEVRKFIKEHLENNGFTVFDFESPTEAKPLISQKKPQVILSDITMPNENGLEFLRDVKSNPEWKHIPFIFLTNIGSQAVRDEARELGVDGYLLKPETTVERVVEEINKILLTKAVT